MTSDCFRTGGDAGSHDSGYRHILVVLAVLMLGLRPSIPHLISPSATRRSLREVRRGRADRGRWLLLSRTLLVAGALLGLVITAPFALAYDDAYGLAHERPRTWVATLGELVLGIGSGGTSAVTTYPRLGLFFGVSLLAVTAGAWLVWPRTTSRLEAVALWMTTGGFYWRRSARSPTTGSCPRPDPEPRVRPGADRVPSRRPLDAGPRAGRTSAGRFAGCRDLPRRPWAGGHGWRYMGGRPHPQRPRGGGPGRRARRGRHGVLVTDDQSRQAHSLAAAPDQEAREESGKG